MTLARRRRQKERKKKMGDLHNLGGVPLIGQKNAPQQKAAVINEPDGSRTMLPFTAVAGASDQFWAQLFGMVKQSVHEVLVETGVVAEPQADLGEPAADSVAV